MCFDCGCRDWTSCHHDIRHLATINIDNVLAANPDLHPTDIVSNIKDGLDMWLKSQSKDADTTKSTLVHTHDGTNYHVHVSIEPE